MKVICRYCNKNYINKYSLLKHQTTKKCINNKKEFEENEIKIQDEIKKKENEEKQIKNELEKLKKEKEILSRDVLNLEKQLEEYKKNNFDLQNRIERITNRAVDKPSLYNSNTRILSLQPFDLSKDYITNKVMNKFNDNHILDGMSGIAKFVKDKIITLEDGSLVYACFDTSRQMFKYKDKDGNVIKDPKSVKLIEMLQPALKEQTTNLYNFFENEIESYEENDLNDTDTISMVDKMKFLKDSTLKIRVEIIEMHENNKFSNELSSIIC